MRVSKWGNSLAIRLPAAIVELLKLKEGDEVEVTLAGERHLEIGHDTSRHEAIARLRALNLKLPPGYTFRRQDAFED